MNLQKQAFTLVELIVVITILAILGTIAFISLQGYSASSRDSVRISDTGNMKTSLELFHLNSGKYPLPDNNETVSYSGDTLWYQGVFGETVVSQLSRNLSEIPTDPLTEREYLFSVVNNKNEFQILTLLESDLSLNTITKTNAATVTVTPKVDGTYNGIFIKTPNYIVPTPSIISAEEILVGSGLVLNSTNIKSQVTNLGKNIPNVGNVTTATGQLNISLSVYEGAITKDIETTTKVIIMQAIQSAYIGSELVNIDMYKTILSAITDVELVSFFDTIVLKNTNFVQNSYIDCTGVNTPEPFLATTTYGVCNTADIIVCNGKGIGYTIAACNVGTNTAATTYNDSNGYGELFQWGNNAGIKTAPTSTTQILVTATGSKYSSGTFIRTFLDWNSTHNNNLWGDMPGTYLDRKGPCEVGYHVPTNSEWINLFSAIGINQTLFSIVNQIKLPVAGYRHWNAASFLYQDSNGYYWSSSPNGDTLGYYVQINSTIILTNATSSRSDGLSVRCFKN